MTTKSYSDLTFEEKQRAYYHAVHSKWPVDMLGELSDGTDIDYSCRVLAARIKIELGEKALTRYSHKHCLHVTDSQFDDWWDSTVKNRIECRFDQLENIVKMYNDTINKNAKSDKKYLKNSTAYFLLAFLGFTVGFLLCLIVQFV